NVQNCPMGIGPQGAALDSQNGNLYVANYPNSVSVISGTTNQVIATIGVGADPLTVAFDSQNGNLYVTNYESNSVTVINGTTNQVIDSIAIFANSEGSLKGFAFLNGLAF